MNNPAYLRFMERHGVRSLQFITDLACQNPSENDYRCQPSNDNSGDEPMADAIIKVGAKAPAFSLLNQDGKKVALKDFAGQWVVLYFYPKDDTSGCTKEACEFTAARALRGAGGESARRQSGPRGPAREIPAEIRLERGVAQRSRAQGLGEVRRVGRKEPVRQRNTRACSAAPCSSTPRAALPTTGPRSVPPAMPTRCARRLPNFARSDAVAGM